MADTKIKLRNEIYRYDVGPNYDNILKNWYVVGGNSYFRNILFVQNFPERKLPEHTNKCICGQYIVENIYLSNSQKRHIIIVGKCCVGNFGNIPTRPNDNEKLRFGKHQGTTFEKLCSSNQYRNYLDWVFVMTKYKDVPVRDNYNTFELSREQLERLIKYAKKYHSYSFKKRITFGKYKGKTYGQVFTHHQDYINSLKQTNDNKNLFIRHFLDWCNSY